MLSLTKRQAAFVNAYIGQTQENATEAARIAGYSGEPQNLAVTGSRLLKHPKVKAEIERLTELAREEMAKQQVHAVLTRVGRQKVLAEIVADETSTKNERMKAVELLGKMEGDFIEHRKVDITEHKSKQEQDKSQDFISTVNPDELKNLLDKTYVEETVN